jgi:hypothetical protein
MIRSHNVQQMLLSSLPWMSQKSNVVVVVDVDVVVVVDLFSHH